MNTKTNNDAPLGRVSRLVMPRRETKRWSELARHLDAIEKASDDAIHKGFCKANKHKLDKALAEIEIAANAAREILRHNVDVDATADDKTQPKKTDV